MDAEADRQRFTRRLEAFSDIVFGFALAQCAVALEVPKNLGDVLAHADELIYFLVRFVLIVMFWVMHYRIFHYVFAARTLDVALNFLLLATIALLPYALRIYIRFPQSVLGSAAYALALGIGLALIAPSSFAGCARCRAPCERGGSASRCGTRSRAPCFCCRCRSLRSSDSSLAMSGHWPGLR